MDNDWDLFAVVKSCTAAAAASSSSTTTTTPVNNFNISPAEGPFPSSGYMDKFLDDDTSVVFPSLQEDRPNGAFEGLEEFCKEFSIDLGLAAAASGITPTTPLPVGQVFQDQHQIQVQPQQHVNLQMQTENPIIGIETTNSRPIRPRKRKNQQKMTVQTMTAEELYADSWAWRKYGRKPIKGSPYPRNYYRCSTSKGCAARKHVEKNPTDPALFLVSYTGEHTHPRPSQRSSFSKSTRTNLITPPTTTSSEPTTNTLIPIGTLPNSSCSSSSMASSSSFSPNTPLVEGQNPAQNEDAEMVEEHVEVEYEDEDEDILIPNAFIMSEEIFRGFRELSGININGSAHSSGSPSQPWTSTSSTAAFNGSRSD